MVAVEARAAIVQKFEIVTPEQTVDPNTISDPITIQAQDNNGNPVQTEETIDLTFTSNSPSGEFLSSTGNPVTTTMNKNTANRTFYYRDSKEGSHTIRVLGLGRDSGKSWDVTHNINIGSGGLTNNLITNSVSTLSTNTGPSNPTENTSVTTMIEVVAGRDRLTSPGSPIIFQGQVKKNTTRAPLAFNWTFGDGTVGVGDTVAHAYKYPGNYVVVLNVFAGKDYATSRFNVTVVEPEISINPKDGYIEISNDSDIEVNLFNWKITKGYNSFIFQPDTIVLPNTSIKIDNGILSMKSALDEGVVLKNAASDIVAIYKEKPEPLILEEIVPDSFYKLVEEHERNAVNKQLVSVIETETKFVEELDITFGDQVEESESGVDRISTTPDSVNLKSEVIFETPKKDGLILRALKFLVGVIY